MRSRPATQAARVPVSPVLAALVLSALAMAASLAGCTDWMGTGGTPTPRTPPPLRVDGRLLGRLTEAQARFGMALIAETIGKTPGENGLISPASISLALAMTLRGADGATREAMARVLGVEGMSQEDLDRAAAALIASLREADPEVELAIADSLWKRPGYPFLPAFIQGCVDYYDAEVQDLTAPEPVNAWVSDKTGGKIKQVLQVVDPATVLLLINAIYFKGQWAVAFDESITRPGPFYKLDGTREDRPFMSQSGTYNYFRGEGFQAVRLPYGNGAVAMEVFLPDARDGLPGFLASLDGDAWARHTTAFAPMEGDILIPRFTFKWEAKLKQPLSELGMARAFDKARADFVRMAELNPGDRLWIHEVLHKTFVEVNEQGTEAAAVTVVEMRAESASIEPGPPRFHFYADHPFFFAIRDVRSGAILFAGVVANP